MAQHELQPLRSARSLQLESDDVEAAAALELGEQPRSPRRRARAAAVPLAAALLLVLGVVAAATSLRQGPESGGAALTVGAASLSPQQQQQQQQQQSAHAPAEAVPEAASAALEPQQQQQQQQQAAPAPEDSEEEEEEEEEEDPRSLFLPPSWHDPAAGCRQYTAAAARHVLPATSAALQAALDAALPGDLIEVQENLTLEGLFFVRPGRSGTRAAPVVLCGGAGATLRGLGREQDQTSVLTLAGVSDWRVVGLAVENGYKAVWAQGVTRCVFDALALRGLGEEGLRLCYNSTRNAVHAVTVADAGSYRPEWGEGLYVGTSGRQWGGAGDYSSYNTLLENVIGPGVAAECIDLKEFTEGHLVAGNACDGAGLRGANFADSLMSIKASRSVIRDNVGVRARGKGHGINVVLRENGTWGLGNVFSNNTFDTQAGGWGIHVGTRGPLGRDNVVKCDNKAPSAALGLSNLKCTP